MVGLLDPSVLLYLGLFVLSCGVKIVGVYLFNSFSRQLLTLEQEGENTCVL